MILRRKVINLLFTDRYISFALVEEGRRKVIRTGRVALKSGIIKHGKIVDERLLSNILGTMFKKHRLRSRWVRIVIPDSNLVIKKLTVPKFLKTDDLISYLKLELEESLQLLPYNDPIIDVKEYRVDEDREEKDIILFTTSEEIITAYLRVIQKHGKSVIGSQISPVLTRRIYLDSKQIRNTAESHVMFVQLRENTNIFTVFDEELPVLSLRDTFEIDELNEEDYLIQIIDMIERVVHFYKYQFTKENRDIEKILIYAENNLTPAQRDVIISKLDIATEFIIHEGLKHSVSLKREDLIPYYLPIALSL